VWNFSFAVARPPAARVHSHVQIQHITLTQYLEHQACIEPLAQWSISILPFYTAILLFIFHSAEAYNVIGK